MEAASNSILFMLSLLLVTAQYNSQFLLPQQVFTGGFHHFKEKENEEKHDGITIPNPLTGESAHFGLPRFDSPVEDHAYKTDYQGLWELVSKDSGANAMHINLLPNNKIIMFDATAFHMSTMKLPNGQCFPYKDEKTGMLNQDCWCHAVEFDIDTAKLRPLKIQWDPWCSSGGLAADGTLVSTGGWLQGTRAVRYMRTCDNCDWKEYPTALADARWYATQATLANGDFILVGGRRSYSYEYVPQEGASNQKSIKFPFLDETSDLDENNLYPFVHLSTDGNVFIFANNRSVLLNPKTNAIIKEFPVLEGGARNYPSSGMSALLPIKLEANNDEVIPVEVIVCGGAKPAAYGLAQKGTFLPALEDCNRLEITNPGATWEKENMPSARVMGDMLNLPNGDLLILNGAKKGTAAWYSADDPNLTPVLYSPDEPADQRFKELEPSTIPRMYHSASAVLPDGRILVGGSNPNAGYNFKAKYPTEMRIEKFSPPYLDPALAEHRPELLVQASENSLTYGQTFSVQFSVNKMLVAKKDIKVTMYAPPFTTHGYSMSQRLLELAELDVDRTLQGAYKIDVMAPPTSAVAPPGYYLLYVVYRGVPSLGMWVQIK
ncbi:aldehyde oxidase GLOX1-like [Carya illinoinensis]|uniref:Galactose oxidase n=1 Tax=Carya illinoinensis TaxID=32201 RepID=A0A8T1R6W8_CARIL|nr:aldehyde oxidase GLOX1-like [Carya illinoinensis]KAG6662214.1 hypothetical protein CIPAW_03G227800 [Carya illinoinensis]KAG6723613.1 hypothetical protein I3842_03G216600 [Carya illinoinensis]